MTSERNKKKSVLTRVELILCLNAVSSGVLVTNLSAGIRQKCA